MVDSEAEAERGGVSGGDRGKDVFFGKAVAAAEGVKVDGEVDNVCESDFGELVEDACRECRVFFGVLVAGEPAFVCTLSLSSLGMLIVRKV
jgi:hypothetical protein